METVELANKLNDSVDIVSRQEMNIEELQKSITSLANSFEQAPTENYMKQMYSSRFEKNDDGKDTYTIVAPLTAVFVDHGYEITVIL